MKQGGNNTGIRQQSVGTTAMSYNGTNLAVQQSLMQIFDEFTEVISLELRTHQIPDSDEMPED